jgi:hypothetical protein
MLRIRRNGEYVVGVSKNSQNLRFKSSLSKELATVQHHSSITLERQQEQAYYYNYIYFTGHISFVFKTGERNDTIFLIDG